MTDRAGMYGASASLWAESSEYLAGGVSSNFRFASTPPPLFFARGLGAHLFDADGRRYIDYTLGMGPALLGHAPPVAIQAVGETLKLGQLYAGQHALESDLARLVCEIVPSAERVRFGLSGSEMVQLALRLARAATSRPRVVKFEGHYHGWFDNILVGVAQRPSVGSDSATATMGQSELAASEIDLLPWNDLEVVKRHLEAQHEQTAAIIMEPVLCNTCVVNPRPGYLQGVRELCDRYGVVLIFDEVITGFRLGLGGAQELFGVRPDLTVLAKAMGGGFPVSALAGREQLLALTGDGRVLHGGTYNTNVVSTAAALAVLGELRRGGEQLYAQLQAVGSTLIDGLRGLAEQSGLDLHVQGFPAVFNTCFLDTDEVFDFRAYAHQDADLQRLFLEALQDRGVRVTGRGTWFLSTAHGEEDVEETLKAAEAALDSLS
jgi:glutamate-1-semialdehyde 2,1-aminomutase